jgi:SAM-dependent methyltransferase
METATRTLIKAYNAGVAEEYQRLESPSGRAEFQQVCHLVSQQLYPYSTIVDIGSGPGRYAEHFLHQGHFVGCVDIASHSLEVFDQRLRTSLKPNLLFNQQSCASQLDWIPDQIADTILLLGPMYHLTSVLNRAIVYRHCSRILKSNGNLYVMYLNPGNDLKTSNNDQHITRTLFQGLMVKQYRVKPEAAQNEAKPFFKLQAMHAIAEKENQPIPSLNDAKQYLIHYQLKKKQMM